MTSKDLEPKNVVQMIMYLSRVKGEVFVAIDGNLLDVNDFGIDTEQFKSLGDGIQDLLRELLRKKNEANDK